MSKAKMEQRIRELEEIIYGDGRTNPTELACAAMELESLQEELSKEM